MNMKFLGGSMMLVSLCSFIFVHDKYEDTRKRYFGVEFDRSTQISGFFEIKKIDKNQWFGVSPLSEADFITKTHSLVEKNSHYHIKIVGNARESADKNAALELGHERAQTVESFLTGNKILLSVGDSNPPPHSDPDFNERTGRVDIYFE